MYQVIGRYVFNSSPTWTESMAILLVLYVTMLGMSVGVRDGGHIGLESLLIMVPAQLRVKLEIFIYLLMIGFGVLMTWCCSELAIDVMSYRIPTLGISEAFKYAAPAIAGGLVSLFSIEHLIALFSGEEVETTWR